MGEVSVLALAEAVARHVDRRPEATVVGVQRDERAALVEVEQPAGVGDADVVETGHHVLPCQSVDTVGDGRCRRCSVPHAAASSWSRVALA